MFRALVGILGHKGHINEDGRNLRGWFIFFVLYLSGLTGLVVLDIHVWQTSMPLWLLALYLFYMSLCCTFFPAPTAWIVLLMASPVIELSIPGVGAGATQAAVRVLLVAAVGAAGTALANLNEYHILTFLLRFGYIGKIRQTGWYHFACRWFDVSPFALLTAFSFVPLPVDVVRWLAVSRDYRRDRYGLAYFLGRLVRYGLLAATAVWLNLNGVQIVGIQAGLILLILLRYVPALLRRLRGQGELDRAAAADKVVQAERDTPLGAQE